MNKSNRFSSQSRWSTVVLLPVAAAFAAGCVSNPPRTEHLVAADNAIAWASQIDSLPVEVHGVVPGETAAETTPASNTAYRAGPEPSSQAAG
jgi:hypothetical protein